MYTFLYKIFKKVITFEAKSITNAFLRHFNTRIEVSINIF